MKLVEMHHWDMRNGKKVNVVVQLWIVESVLDPGWVAYSQHIYFVQPHCIQIGIHKEALQIR